MGLKALDFAAALRLQFPQGYADPSLTAWSAVSGLAHVDLDCVSLSAPAMIRDVSHCATAAWTIRTWDAYRVLIWEWPASIA